MLRALEIDPANLKALALAGTAAFARKDYARAAALGEDARVVPPTPRTRARSAATCRKRARSAGSPEVAR